MADTVDWPLLMDATAEFVYVRLHGSQQLHASGYGPKALKTWARCIQHWGAGHEVEGHMPVRRLSAASAMLCLLRQ